MKSYERTLYYPQRAHGQKLPDNHEALHADPAEWLSRDWCPRAHQAGPTSPAVVCTPDITARRSAAEALQGTTGGSVAELVDPATAQQVLPGQQTVPSLPATYCSQPARPHAH